MGNPSKLFPFFFAFIVFLMPLVSLSHNDFSTFAIKTVSYLVSFSENPNHNGHITTSSNERDKSRLWRKAFIGLKNTHEPSSNISRAISLNARECFPVELPSDAITSTRCCPPRPSPSNIIDFKDFASPNATLRVRKPAHMVDEEYITKLEKGIALMKALPDDDPRNFIQQAKVHCAYCNGAYHLRHPFQDTKLNIHRSWFFFPFHRWYLYFFERTLGKLIGDPNFALPFWNWDSVEGMQIPSYFNNPNSSLYHQLRNQNHLPPHVVDLNYNKLDPNDDTPSHQQVSYNLAFMYKQMVLASTKELFMGSPFRLGDNPTPGMGSIEAAPHNTVHTWVGAADKPHHEDMGAFYTAARDPIFYAHHPNSDRLWGLWKTLEGGRKDYSDDPDWLDSEFYFYDENANFVRVKVRDCLDTKKLGYVYEDVDLPWLRTPPTSPKSKLLREANKSPLLSSKPSKFPLVLDSITSTVVKRPKKLRSKEEKEQEEEVLVIEGIEFGSDKYVKFDVHIDDDEDNLSEPDQTEFVGTFVNLFHGQGHNINTSFKVGISKVLECLEAEEDDVVLVTLVPKVGKGDVIIGGIKIEFIPK
ncbi:polyphenol oxidase I, chloroplastic-like [Glycine soja]|uniref:Polyphenol oxidase, chloroplastic n=1 Tax=Glycine soja TaxID=3848 RepID=A0A445FXH7_GLYSO|nr:polyphenol oxidase I, chloroplastic-like [Glycine soja]RZB53617.1 Polyphenol oxidase, chloroplastic [Glycine soja]